MPTNDEVYSDAAARGDDVLSRMLSTPPKPHEFGKESKAGKKPKKG